MTSNTKKTLIVITITLLLSACTTIFAYASEPKDYSIGSAWWEESEIGAIHARWDKPQDTTKYKVHLYKTETMVPIGAWKSCSSTAYNFTSDILSYGTGSYYFEVYPEKGGDGLTITSEELIVDNEMLRKARAGRKTTDTEKKKTNVDRALQQLGPGNAVNDTGSDRWLKTPDKNWVRQKPDGSLYKNQWLDIDGKRYLFDASGYMQKNGWRSIGSVWYYLGSDGAMLINTKTPDGFTVNGEGQCVINGEVYKSYLGPYTKTSSGSAGQAITTSLTKIHINAVEYKSEEGKPDSIEIIPSRGAHISDIQYSVAYESWRPGRPVGITIRLNPIGGYYFAKGLKISSSKNLKINSAGGNEQERVVKLTYTPKLRLSEPTGFYMEDGNILHWNKVDSASRYRIRVWIKGAGTETLYTTSPEYDMTDYIGEEAKVSITAEGKATSKSILSSAPYTIDNLDIFTEDATIEGKLVKTAAGYKYENADGEKVTGWVEILGNWYHFTKGNADGPGWYEDRNGNFWYYFDSECKMVTGRINDNGTEYFLNDGSDTTRPLGAWIK